MMLPAERAMEAAFFTAEDLKSRLLVLLPGGWLVAEALTVLRMPDGVLSLGKDLDVPVPVVFATLDLPELVLLVKFVEPGDTVCDGCGADDWADLVLRNAGVVRRAVLRRAGGSDSGQATSRRPAVAGRPPSCLL